MTHGVDNWRVNGKLRWTKDWKESLAVMDALDSDEEDDEDE